jgi:hypothetical protein
VSTSEFTLHPLFVRGPFELGEPQSFATTPNDYATEFAAREYLAVATLGQPVAVGTLSYEVELPEPGAFAMHMIDLAVVPGRGVWALVPVFRDYRTALDTMAYVRQALEAALERPLGDLPLAFAFVPVTERVAVRRPNAIDPATVYGHEIYRDVAGTLRPTGEPAAVDELVERLLEVGDWLDGKQLAVDVTMDNLPEWLGLQLEAADIGLQHFDPGWRERTAPQRTAM